MHTLHHRQNPLSGQPDPSTCVPTHLCAPLRSPPGSGPGPSLEASEFFPRHGELGSLPAGQEVEQSSSRDWLGVVASWASLGPKVHRGCWGELLGSPLPDPGSVSLPLPGALTAWLRGVHVPRLKLATLPKLSVLPHEKPMSSDKKKVLASSLTARPL